MPLTNATINAVTLSGEEGTSQSAGIAYLTITADNGYYIAQDALRIGLASQTAPNEWTGGNVTPGINKVVFIYPGLENSQVTAEVYYDLFMWDNATDLYIDIDGLVRAEDPKDNNGGDPCKGWSNYFDSNVYQQNINITHATNGLNNGSLIVSSLNNVPGKCKGYEEGQVTPSGAISSGLQNTIAILHYGTYGQWQDAGLGYQTGDSVQGAGVSILGTQSTYSFLYPGQYTLEYRDTSCHGTPNNCDNFSVPIVIEDNSPVDNSIDDFSFGETALIEPNILPTAQVRSVTIQHGRNASFELEAFDLGTGHWYDFDSNSFSVSRTSVIVDEPGTRSTSYQMNFPTVSETARYHMFVTPLKNSKINLNRVPTVNNRKFINQRVNNTVTLSLSSTDNSSNWGSFTTKTLTGKPHSIPKAKVKSQKSVGYKTVPQGAHVNVEFSITAAFSSGGGKSSVTVDGPPAYLSAPRIEDTIVSYDTEKATNKEDDGKEMYVTNKVSISSTTATYSSNTLTVTGRMSVEQFGSTSETFYIDIDNFVTLS